jgi:hypothetical protein
MPKEPDESADNERQNKSVFQSWTPDDRKLLIITIAATVAANIITVILVALAIILARSFRPHPRTTGNYESVFGSSLLPALGVWTVLSFWRHSRRKRATDSVDRMIRWTMAILGIFEGLFILSYILAFIGFAAGVR